jgi:DNA primase
MSAVEGRTPAKRSTGVLSLQRDALSYYSSVLSLIAASFEGVPVVWATYPNPKDPPVFHGPLREQAHVVLSDPAFVALSDAALAMLNEVETQRGRVDVDGRTYYALQRHTLEWLAGHDHAVEFHSWTPIAKNPLALRYARILLETGSDGRGPSPKSTRDAAIVLRALLRERGLRAIPLLDGNGGVTLYIPFDDAPNFEDVRRWLHTLANDAAARYPDLFATEPNGAGGSRVHVHVRNNAPGLFSALPYSLRGPDGRCAVAPVTWDELADFSPDHLQIESAKLLDRIAERGDLFASQRDTIRPQRFAALAKVVATDDAPKEEPRGHVLRAALEILVDGHSRSAEDLLKEGIARGLLPASTSYRYVYNALVQYIERNVARRRKPAVIQNPDRTFRINEPLDDWPDVDLPPVPPPGDATKALIARLRATVSGTDPAAWEVAVCDAFAHLGFRSMHLGGHKVPDGYADACLGPLGYRVMLECKTGAGVVPHPDVAEAAKWTDEYNAQFNALVGPGFPEETELHAELLAHRVSAWTVDDLVTALDQRLDLVELRVCFAPGYAADAMLDILWERAHGERKRVLFAAETIAGEGWATQVASGAQADPDNAPHLTIDAAMLLVQAALTRANATRACTRGEVKLAFEHLTDPMLATATWLDEVNPTIVIVKVAPPVR